MRRSIAVAAAVFLLVTAFQTATPVGAADQDVKACFILPDEPGCVTTISVQIGWHVRLVAKAPWHAGGRVDLWQLDPGETRYHRVAKLRFNEKGRATWLWNAPDEVECCWYWRFKALNGSGEVIAVSNRLRADAAPGD